jgi:hypothetical protein
MAAGALFFDAADRILMVEPTYKDYWDIPGGYVETGESPLHAASTNGRLSQDHLAQIALQPDELKGFSFLPTEQVAERTIPRLARRILAAAEARTQRAPVYLEHGQKPDGRAA